MEGDRRRLFCFAMQSRRRRKKAGDGRCGIKIEATPSSPVFGQTKPIEGARGSGLKKTVRRNRDVATTIGLTLSRFARRAAPAAPSRTNLNLNAETMMSSTSPSSMTTSPDPLPSGRIAIRFDAPRRQSCKRRDDSLRKPLQRPAPGLDQCHARLIADGEDSSIMWIPAAAPPPETIQRDGLASRGFRRSVRRSLSSRQGS